MNKGEGGSHIWHQDMVISFLPLPKKKMRNNALLPKFLLCDVVIWFLTGLIIHQISHLSSTLLNIQADIQDSKVWAVLLSIFLKTLGLKVLRYTTLAYVVKQLRYDWVSDVLGKYSLVKSASHGFLSLWHGQLKRDVVATIVYEVMPNPSDHK